MQQALNREVYQINQFNLTEHEISIHKALIEISKYIKTELADAGSPPAPNQLFPNSEVFIIAGGYARDLVSFWFLRLI